MSLILVNRDGRVVLKKTIFAIRDVVLLKEVWKRTQKLTILKHLRTHFKAKHEKGVGTPFPRVPAQLNPCSPYGNSLHGVLTISTKQTVRCPRMLEMENLEKSIDILFARLFLVILSSLVAKITALKTMQLLVPTCVFI